MRKKRYLHGRGAQINPPSPFEKIERDEQPLDWALCEAEWESAELRTEYLETHPKTILNPVKSADIPAEWSLNPYQGCEHGCVYCYARNTHPYWGFSAGLDFERKILVKRNAAELLETMLKKRTWKASPILLAGNTDVYQPAERHFRITRACLEVFWRYRHPVAIITKNSLILRDLDLLEALAAEQLVHVAISLTTLQEPLRQFLEPRTATTTQRLRTLEALSARRIPVLAMLAPIIPGLNDVEILPMAQAAAERGAQALGYTLVRLNGDVATIFEDWLRKNLPDRADKVLNGIRQTHSGYLHDHRPHIRMHGEGPIAQLIGAQIQLARHRFFASRQMPPFNLTSCERYRDPQGRLF